MSFAYRIVYNTFVVCAVRFNQTDSIQQKKEPSFWEGSFKKKVSSVLHIELLEL